jgi:hypothetical protein
MKRSSKALAAPTLFILFLITGLHAAGARAGLANQAANEAMRTLDAPAEAPAPASDRGRPNDTFEITVETEDPAAPTMRERPAVRQSGPSLLSSVLLQWPLLVTALLVGFVGGMLGQMMPVGAKRRRAERAELDASLRRLVDERVRAHTASDQQGPRVENEVRNLAERVKRIELEVPARNLRETWTKAMPGAAHEAVEFPQEDEFQAAERMLTARYGQLLAGTPRPRQFNEMVWDLNGRSLRSAGTGRLAISDFTGNDVNELLVAIPDGNRFLVVPTYDYLSEFQSAFGVVIQNPDHIRHYFDLRPDGIGQLRLLRPAVGREDEAGRMQVVEKGILSGFTG